MLQKFPSIIWSEGEIDRYEENCNTIYKENSKKKKSKYYQYGTIGGSIFDELFTFLIIIPNTLQAGEMNK